MALRRVWIHSPNCSSRGGSGVRLVVLHTAEGARGFRSLGAFFANPASQVSSHVGIDDERGVIGEYVHRPDKAWTQANYNPMAVSCEMCASPLGTTTPCGSNWPRVEWMRHDAMLANVADWIREECNFYGLPIVKLSAGQAQGGGRGVCGHVDLGAGGGGHFDPGPNFPWREVMDMARGGAPPPKPQPPKLPEDTVALAVELLPDGRHQVYCETKSGEVFRAWQSKDGSGAGWARNDKGGFWHTMGVPGK